MGMCKLQNGQRITDIVVEQQKTNDKGSVVTAAEYSPPRPPHLRGDRGYLLWPAAVV